MARGWKDFTKPVTIEAVTIETLPVNITAQTIATLKVDIAAQSLGTIASNVVNFPNSFPLPADQLSSLKEITIQNIAAGLVFDVNISQVTAALNIANFPSEYPLPASQVSSLQQITIQNIAAGLYIPIDIKQVSAALNIANMPSEFPLPASQIGQLQQITIQNVASGLNIPVNIAQATATLNIGNFPSSYPLPDAQVSSLKQITIQNVASGLYIPIDIKQVSTTLNISNFPSTYPLPSDQVSSLQQVTINNVAAGLYIPVNIGQVSTTLNTQDTIVGVAAGVYIPITIHNVEAGVVFNVNISGISSGVTFNINIASSTVPLKMGQVKPTLSFDGVNDYVDCGMNSSIELTHVGSISLWVNYVSTGLYQILIADGDLNSNINGYIFYITAYNQLRFELDSTTARNVNTARAITPGVWNHVAVTWDGSRIKMYINGALVSDDAQTLDAAAGIYPVRVGRSGGGPAFWFNGLIDEVCVYSRALSADEILRNYNNPNSPVTNGLVMWLPLDEGAGTVAHDKSGNNNNGTIYGATWVSSEGSVPCTVNVNIAGQVQALNVSVTSAVTLNVNISSITSGVTFNVAQSGTWTINIGAPLDASGNLKTSIQSSVTLNVNITGSTTLNVNISSVTSGVTFNVNITGSTTLNVNITSISSGVTFNVNITGSTTLNIYVQDFKSTLTPTALLEKGTQVIKVVYGYNLGATLYTVPSGKTAYVITLRYYAHNYSTSLNESIDVWANVGGSTKDIVYNMMPAGGDSYDTVTGGVVKLNAGDILYVFTGSDVWAHVSCVIIEV
jgi:hypothetical protein